MALDTLTTGGRFVVGVPETSTDACAVAPSGATHQTSQRSQVTTAIAWSMPSRTRAAQCVSSATTSTVLSGRFVAVPTRPSSRARDSVTMP